MVTNAISFQIPGAPDDEAVRIFLEFERVESAIKGEWQQVSGWHQGAPVCVSDQDLACLSAVVDLNGRYFGGRVVKACFYNLDKFRVLDLAEQV